MNFYKYTLYFFILSIPLVDVLTFDSWFPIPLLLSFFLFIFGIYIKRYFYFDLSDFLLYFSIFFMLLPLIFAFDLFNTKTFNHILGFMAPILLYYMIPRDAIIYNFKKYHIYDHIYMLIAYSVLFISLYILLEFILDNIFNFDIDRVVPHITRTEYIAETAGNILRARGSSSESGVMAIFYEGFFLLSYIYVRNRCTFFKLIFTLTSLLAYITLFSSAGFFLFSISLLYIYIKNFLFKFNIIEYIFFIIVSIILIYFIYDFLIIFYNETFLDKLSLITGSYADGSSLERALIFSNLIELIIAFPFGIGMGMPEGVNYLGSTYKGLNISDGYISLYGTVLAYGGIPSLLFFLFWILYKIFRLKNITENYYLFYAASFSILTHFSIVSEYWLPFLWVFLALTDFEFFYHKKFKDKINY